MAPKATMLGRYTTGLLALWSFKAGFFLISILACGGERGLKVSCWFGVASLN
jgi:hypothetical protein